MPKSSQTGFREVQLPVRCGQVMLFCEVKLVSADGVSLNGSTEMEMIDTLASKSGPKDVLRFLSKWVVGRQVSLQLVKINDTTKILPSKEVKLIDSLC